MAFLDGSVVNLALPAISREFGGGLALQQWVMDGYLLTLGALILVAGAISEPSAGWSVLQDGAGRLRGVVAAVRGRTERLGAGRRPLPAGCRRRVPGAELVGDDQRPVLGRSAGHVRSAPGPLGPERLS